MKPIHPPNAWHLRLTAGLVLLVWLGIISLRNPAPGEAWLLAASFAIVGHLLIGVWVFLHKLKAVTPWHKTADAFAFLFLFAAVASTNNTPLWCAFFAGLFAVAILKYHQCLHADLPEPLKAYCREKIRLEAPAVALFVLAGLISERLPPAQARALFIEAALFAGAALFAVYLILIRRIYQRI